MEWSTRLNIVIVVLHDILHQARVIVFYFPAMCHSLATATPWVKEPNLLVSLHPNVGFHNLRRWWSKWPQQLAAMLAAGLVCLFKCREMWCTPPKCQFYLDKYSSDQPVDFGSAMFKQTHSNRLAEVSGGPSHLFSLWWEMEGEFSIQIYNNLSKMAIWDSRPRKGTGSIFSETKPGTVGMP